jgi:hypothetical protein
MPPPLRLLSDTTKSLFGPVIQIALNAVSSTAGYVMVLPVTSAPVVSAI